MIINQIKMQSFHHDITTLLPVQNDILLSENNDNWASVTDQFVCNIDRYHKCNSIICMYMCSLLYVTVFCYGLAVNDEICINSIEFCRSQGSKSCNIRKKTVEIWTESPVEKCRDLDSLQTQSSSSGPRFAVLFSCRQAYNFSINDLI